MIIFLFTSHFKYCIILVFKIGSLAKVTNFCMSLCPHYLELQSNAGIDAYLSHVPTYLLGM